MTYFCRQQNLSLYLSSIIIVPLALVFIAPAEALPDPGTDVTVSAEAPQPNSSISTPNSANPTNYGLFNPVPDDALRGFSSNRPTKTSTPITVDAGHFQYETDLANYTYDHFSSAAPYRQWVFLDPNFSVGLNSWLDAELTIVGRQEFHSTSASASGLGDLFPRLKANLIGNDGGDLAVALSAYLKIPTSDQALRRAGVTNDAIEGGVLLPVVYSLHDGWSVSSQIELDALNDAALGEHFTNASLSFILGKQVDAFTASLELWGDIADDRNTAGQVTLDPGFAYLVTPNLQLDFGINVGLNKAALDYNPYLGLSQRF